MAGQQEGIDERAPLLPTTATGSSQTTAAIKPSELEGDDPMAIEVNRKLTKVDIAWRIVFTAFAGFLVAIVIKAIADTDSPDVSIYARTFLRGLSLLVIRHHLVDSHSLSMPLVSVVRLG